MSRKWLMNEGPKWVKQNIISDRQFEQILAQYDHKQQGLSILTVLGSILIGLGILSFIAANWQEIPQLLRLGLVAVIMCSFYIGGSALYERGHANTGTALLGIGLLSFGAGIFLIAQMYHLTSNSVSSFLVWSASGLALLYLYGSRYLFIVTAVILNIAQFYSMMQFHSYSYLALLFTIFGLGYYVLRTKDHLLASLTVVSLLIQSFIWLAERDFSFFWIYLVLAGLYTLGDILHQYLPRRSMQIVPIIMAFVIAAWFAFMDFPYIGLRHILEDMNGMLFSSIWIVLFLLSAMLKFRRNSEAAYSIADWLLLLPVFFIDKGTDWFYLAILFVFSLFVLLDGYREQSRFRVNIGTLLFLFVTLLSYMKLTSGFMDKSIMFITGGFILFALSWFLNHRRKQVLGGSGGKKQ